MNLFTYVCRVERKKKKEGERKFHHLYLNVMVMLVFNEYALDYFGDDIHPSSITGTTQAHQSLAAPATGGRRLWRSSNAFATQRYTYFIYKRT